MTVIEQAYSDLRRLPPNYYLPEKLGIEGALILAEQLLEACKAALLGLEAAGAQEECRYDARFDKRGEGACPHQAEHEAYRKLRAALALTAPEAQKQEEL